MSKYISINGHYTDYSGFLYISGQTDANLGDSVFISIDGQNYEFELSTENTKSLPNGELIFSLQTITVSLDDPIDVEISLSGSISPTTSISPNFPPSLILIDSAERQKDGKLLISGVVGVDDATDVVVQILGSSNISLTTTVSDGEWSVSTASEIVPDSYDLLASVINSDGVSSATSKKLNIVVNPEYIRFFSHNVTSGNLKPTIYGTVGISKTTNRGYDTKKISQNVVVEIKDEDSNVVETFDVEVDSFGAWNITPTNNLEDGKTYIINAKSFIKNFIGYEKEVLECFEVLSLNIDSTITDYSLICESTIHSLDEGGLSDLEDECVFQDAMPRSINDSLNREDGWYYINDYTPGAPTNDKKINWAISDQYAIPYTFEQIKTVYALIELDSVSDIPYWALYTQKQSTLNAGSWYRSRMTYANFDSFTPTSPGEYLIHIKDEPSVYPDVSKVKMIKEGVSTTIGPQEPTEKMLLMALNTSSSEAAGNYQFFVKEIGYETNDGAIFKVNLR